MAEVKEAPAQEEILNVTPSAATKIKDLQEREELHEKGLRVRVVGGGCHGFSYALGFDEKKETDTVQSVDGINFLIDKFSAPYLAGASIDYIDGLEASGFKIGNPNAKSTCGCGESFTV